MEKILISACLAGKRVRYDGKKLPIKKNQIYQWYRQGRLVIVCPEVSGGLHIPRPAAQIVGGTGHDVLSGNARVIDIDQNDVTRSFVKGAHDTLLLAQKCNIRVAVFKEKSPSCGVGQIYDGTFSSSLMPGSGVTVALLKENNVQVFSENTLDQVHSFLDVESSG